MRKKRKVKIYGKFAPYPWQKETHDYITDYLGHTKKVAETIVIKASRQMYGKSAFCRAELIRFALSEKGSENAYVSPKLKLARKMFRQLKKGLKDFVISYNSVDLIMELANGSVIQCHSEQQGEALRGFTVTGLLIIDEASSFKDDTYYELIAPWTTVHKALTIIVSTPKYKMGFFFDNYLDGLDESNPYYKTFDWIRKYHVEIPPEELAKKAKMPIGKWKSEYLGLFLDAEGAVFGDFSDCLIELQKYKYEEMYLGLDFGTGCGEDYTVLTGFDEFGNQRFIWAVNDLTPNMQVRMIKKIIQTFEIKYSESNALTKKEFIYSYSKIKAFYAEKNSIGAIYIKYLESANVVCQPFTMDNKKKRKLVEQMQVAIQNKAVGLLKDQEQTQQLSFFKSKVDKATGKVTYGAPDGFHDDYIIAVLLAYHGYIQAKFGGQYNVV